MDVVELMEWLAERGCSVVIKADGERGQGHRWMVIVSGGALGDGGIYMAIHQWECATFHRLLV
ncbi:hypothetical protein [Streptomyces sp. NPDC008312]|uniref:hypothetical protein n=1 Tax=Streptomyces sp. NPDC008312 TaxID=3364825 RepID=UPI0036EF881F